MGWGGGEGRVRAGGSRPTLGRGVEKGGWVTGKGLGEERGREGGRPGGLLIGLVPVVVAVAVGPVAGGLLLLGQLGLGGQDGGEGEEAGRGGDGGQRGLAQAQRKGGHGQGQPLELGQLVSLELPDDGVHLWGGDLLGPLYGPQDLLLVLLGQVGEDLSADPIQPLHYLGLFVHLNVQPVGHLVVHDIMALHL